MLVVSGGVSLGSYQGGVNWAIVELARRFLDPGFRHALEQDPSFGHFLHAAGQRRDSLPVLTLEAATGASAGNINALISAIEWCHVQHDKAPEQSLFWKVWVRTGWEQLLPASGPSEADRDSALFDRRYFSNDHRNAVEAALTGSPMRAGCSVPVGIAITKLEADSIQLARQLPVWAATQRFASIFYVKGSPGGDSLVFARDSGIVEGRWNDAAFGNLAVLETESSTGRIPLQAVFALVQASGAFPYVFAPVALTYVAGGNATGRSLQNVPCYRRAHGCDISRAHFVDGGVFDNNPLDLAFGLAHNVGTSLTNQRQASVVAKYGPEVKADTEEMARLASVLDSLKRKRDSLRNILEDTAVASGAATELSTTSGNISATDQKLNATKARAADRLLAREADLNAAYQLQDQQLVFLNPGLYRNPLRTTRVNQLSGGHIATGGIDALTQLIGQAVSAGTQYELQSLARALARDTGGVYYKARWVRTTTRSAPIVGEHLQHFAAFFGRPFREYDFYVGMYDGFDYIAREVMCRVADTTEAQPFDMDQCTASAKRALLLADSVSLGPLAPRIIRSLFRRENHEELRLPAADSARLSGELERTGWERAVLLDALDTANALQFDLSPDRDCAARPLAERMLCADRFSNLVESFARSARVRRIISSAANDTSCRRRQWEQAPDNPHCVADESLEELVDDPYRFAHQALQRLLLRAAAVEQARKMTHEVDHTAIPELARYVYLGYFAPPRRVQFAPSSLPADARIGWRWLTPHELGVNLTSGGVDVTQRVVQLTISRTLKTDIALPVTPVNWRPSQGSLKNQAFSGVGTGVLMHTSSIALSSVQLGPEYLLSWRDLHRGSRLVASGSIYLLADRLRVGLRWRPRPNRDLLQGRRWDLSLGIADFNGLAYWVIKAL